MVDASNASHAGVVVPSLLVNRYSLLSVCLRCLSTVLDMCVRRMHDREMGRGGTRNARKNGIRRCVGSNIDEGESTHCWYMCG